MVVVKALGAALPDSVQLGSTVADKRMSWSMALAAERKRREMTAQANVRANGERMEYSTKWNTGDLIESNACLGGGTHSCNDDDGGD